MGRQCTKDGCARPLLARGLCNVHYKEAQQRSDWVPKYRRGKYRNRFNPDGKGRSTRYIAPCGHVTSFPRGKMCKACWMAQAKRVTNGGYLCSNAKGSRSMVHREIAEAALGRPLKGTEIVHHIDMDKANNRNDNLIICTRKYHNFLHYQMQLMWVRRYQNAPRIKGSETGNGNRGTSSRRALFQEQGLGRYVQAPAS